MQVQRDVTNKEISNSYRGILRVSPSEDGKDTGLDPVVEKTVSDSVGNTSTIKLSQNTTSIDNLSANNLTIPGDLTFNSSTDVDTSAPGLNDILIGNASGNYTKADITEIILNELKKYNILASIVPVGTVFYNYMKTPNISQLPAQFRNGDWAIADGLTTYSAALYPEFVALTGVTVNGGNFTIPDLRNRFIRCYSGQSTQQNNTPEGTITISAHNPQTTEVQQTNYSGISNFNIDLGGFSCSSPQGFGYLADPDISKCAWGSFRVISGGPSQITGKGNTWSNLNIELKGSVAVNNQSIRETRPYNISLVPIIKLR